MGIELEEFTEWRISVEARIARLEALYFSRYDFRDTPIDHTARLIKLRSDQMELLAGIKTIIGLLNRRRDGAGGELS